MRNMFKYVGLKVKWVYANQNKIEKALKRIVEIFRVIIDAFIFYNLFK